MRHDIAELARVLSLSYSLEDITEISDIEEEAIVRLLIFEGLIDLEDYFSDNDYLNEEEDN
jgi:hypothetical protein|tara:strand:- start:25 stop:207 length:183 start_codon:yes stop_codon:yes gene_type:complete